MLLYHVNLIIISKEFISDGRFFANCLFFSLFTYDNIYIYIPVPFSPMAKKK